MPKTAIKAAHAALIRWCAEADVSLRSLEFESFQAFLEHLNKTYPAPSE